MLKWIHSVKALYVFPLRNHQYILWRRSCLCYRQQLITREKYTILPQMLQNKHFHRSSVNSAAPIIAPLLVKLTTPLSRVVFLLLGRRFRKWWKSLPHEKKHKYVNTLIKNRNRAMVTLGMILGVSFSYYVYHLENTPVTGRKRFMILNNEQLEKVADVQWRNISRDLSEFRLPIDHPAHMRVYRVATRILNANISKEVKELKWEINVINNDEVNAFVLANGQIYVFTGMLAIAANDGELAGVLGHEMAHAILGHSAEHLSHAGFVNLYSTAILATIWAILPSDVLAFAASWIQSSIEDLIITLPYSRKLEKEADEVGLKLAARACFDVREVPKFWERMHSIDKHSIVQKNDWLSTHPSHENRVGWLTEWLPDALMLRQNLNCPELREFQNTTKKAFLLK